MAKTHYFPEDQVHYVWDNEQEPVLTVEPGDTVVYHTREVSDLRHGHREPHVRRVALRPDQGQEHTGAPVPDPGTANADGR